MKGRIIFLACVVAICMSCKEVVHFDLDEQSRALVLNCVIDAGRDSIRIDLTQTKSPDEEMPWKTFPDAEVRVFEDDHLLGRAKWSTQGYFLYYYRGLPGHTYRIEADVSGYEKVWGETTVPDVLNEYEIELQYIKENGTHTYQADFHWQDIPGKRNFYWISAQYVNRGWNDSVPDFRNVKDVFYLVTKSSLPDPFNRVFDEGSDAIFDYYIRIEDSGLDGRHLDLSSQCFYFDAWQVRAYMLNADVHCDAYLKSIIENDENSVTIDEFPLIYHSAYVHTNIHGGVGLVASFTSVEKVINIPGKDENEDNYIAAHRME